MTIIQRIMDVVESKGLRISDLADLLNVGTSTISNWKARNTDPPSKYILPICEFLQVSPYWLLSGEDEPINVAAALPANEEKAVRYYRRLSEDNQDIIIGKMAELYQNQQADDTGGKRSENQQVG